MAKRILTGLLIAAGIVAAVWWGPFWLVASVFGLVILGAQQELLRMPEGASTRADQVAGGLAGLAVLFVAAVGADGARGHSQLIATIMAASLFVLLWVLFSPHPMQTAAGRAARLLSGMLYIVVLGATAILAVRPEHEVLGRTVLLLAAGAAGVGDSAAFFGGKFLGRHKMYPAVSPNKTWEGSFFGVLGSVLGTLLIARICMPELPVLQVAVFGVIGAFLGQTGDLAESMFKRSAGVKDSGNILPGHGGLLDRIDAFLFIVPFGYWYFLAGAAL